MDIVKTIWLSIVEDAKFAFLTISNNQSSIFITIAIAAFLGMIIPNFLLGAVFVGALLALAYNKFVEYIDRIENE